MTSKKREDVVEIFKNQINKKWYWRLVSPNGKIIADGGESYVSRSRCREMAMRCTGKTSVTDAKPMSTDTPRRA